MVLQFEQKFRSDEQRASLGVPRSLIALYFLLAISDCHGKSIQLVVWNGWSVLDKIFAFEDLETVGNPA